jgi:hypothetical protein
LTIRSLQVSRASLQLGKIYFLNEGKIAKAVEMLNPPHAKLISFWFTPLYFSYDKGSLGISRFDLLVMDLYPLATWGTVNFLNDRMDMTIGLTGEAIEKAFKIPVVEPNYMLQLPLRGSIARAKIDKTKLTARLAALFASVAAGPEGLLLWVLSLAWLPA